MIKVVDNYTKVNICFFCTLVYGAIALLFPIRCAIAALVRTIKDHLLFANKYEFLKPEVKTVL